MVAWTRHVDVKSGRPYYYNRATKETTWKIPEEFAISGQEREAAIDQFLKGTKWRRANRDGKSYYYDKETKKTPIDTKEMEEYGPRPPPQPN